VAHEGDLVFLSDFETMKTKGGEGKGMKNKKEGFLSIRVVPPSMATLFLKGLIGNYNFNATKLNKQEKKRWQTVWPLFLFRGKL